MMRYSRALFGLVPLVAVALQALPLSAVHEPESQTSTTEEWIPGYHTNGISDFAFSMCEYQGKLIVGGGFPRAGDVKANSIAAFDGSSWSTLGSGITSSIRAMVVYEDRLIVGGAISKAGGQAVRNIAAWNGEQWEPLGSGMNGEVQALTVFDGDLIAAGSFTEAGGAAASAIARWDGTQWHPLGAGLSGSTTMVSALTVFDGNLVAAGFFHQSGGLTVSNVAQWDGQDWASLGSGANWSVEAMCIYEDRLVVAGLFTLVGASVPAKGFASWDGSSWSALPLEVPNPYVALALFEHEGSLMIGGNFREVNSTPVGSVFSWDGDTIDTLWGGVTGGSFTEVHDFSVFGGKLYMCGRFATSQGRLVIGIGVLSPNGWQPLTQGLGLSGSVSAFLEFNGAVVAAGDFSFAGSEPAERIAAFNGDSWSAFGDGVDGSVRALALYDGDVIAAGFFTGTGDEPVNHIARWNGVEWSPLAEGLDGPVATCLTVGDSLIVGGWFSMAGGVPAMNIALWNGSQWSPMGEGFDFPVLALTEWEGAVIAGGNFQRSGTDVVAYIARWNGNGWESVGSGTDGPVLALHVFRDKLVAGGSFYRAGGQVTAAIAQWDGLEWSSLGTGVGVVVNALVTHNDNLFAGGFFAAAGGTPRKWDGESWSSLGAGVDGEIFALHSRGVDLYVGGWFGTAGSTPSNRIAVWKEAETPITVSDLSASWLNGDASLSWVLRTQGEPARRVYVQRAMHKEGPFETISEILSTTPGRQTFLDRHPLAGSDVWYRICVENGQAEVSCTATVKLAARGVNSFGLGAFSFVEPNLVRIEFSLVDSSARVSLDVFDVRGRRVRQLFQGMGSAGMNSVEWDVTPGSTAHVPRGIYFVRLTSGNRSSTRKIPLVR